MPTLRIRRMKRPLPWLCALALLVLVAILDSTRAPPHQISARLYLGSVCVYQRDIHPLTSRYIRCRYKPTCSHYSTDAVRRFGIAKGLRLTIKRIVSCNRTVQNGTYDPVPN